MRLYIILAVVALLFASESNAQRRRQQNRNGRLRGGRQLDTGYGAPESREEPETLYGAPSEEVLDVRAEEELPSYAEEAPLDTYNNDLDAEASALDSKSADSGLDMLMNSIPGIPGEDYPIYSEAPETEFSCEGQVNGGYYADPAAECQVFHICSDDGTGALNKFSFLCPNGTIFNQAYFICDWWFNVDCSEAEALAESRNGDLLAAYGESEADLEAEASTGYGSPVVEAKAAEESYGAPEEAPQATYGASAADSAEYPASDYIYDY